MAYSLIFFYARRLLIRDKVLLLSDKGGILKITVKKYKLTVHKFSHLMKQQENI